MFCDLVSDTFLTQMNHSPTRIIDNTENSIVDLVFIDQPERICGLETFDFQFASDHLGVAFLINIKVKRQHVVRYAYDFKKTNFDALRQALSVLSRDMGFDESDVDQCWKSWRDLFLNAVESFIPKIKIKQGFQKLSTLILLKPQPSRGQGKFI